MNTNRELLELTTAWSTIQNKVQLRPVRDEADFDRIHALANWLADEVGEDESHPLSSLFDIVLQLMEDWEAKNNLIPDVEPRDVLRHLLESNGLKQKDLGNIASQTLISDILAGRREISKRLAKALSERFKVDVAAFV